MASDSGARLTSMILISKFPRHVEANRRPSLAARREIQMPEETEKDILKNIRTLLEDTKGLILVVNQDKLDEMKKKLLKAGSIESQVYELCDGTNTAQAIATKIQKTSEYAGAVISNLRRKGLVRTVDRGGNRVYEQIF